MYRRTTLILGILCIIFPATLSSTAKEGAALYVQVRQSKLRAAAEFWAPALRDLTYGSVLTLVSAAPSDKSWLKVKFGENEGYVHISAVTKRKIVLSGNSAPAGKGVDQTSIVLAGKGFNSQVENKYKAAQGLDFAVVDEVERLGVESIEEATFIKVGKLVG